MILNLSISNSFLIELKFTSQISSSRPIVLFAIRILLLKIGRDVFAAADASGAKRGRGKVRKIQFILSFGREWISTRFRCRSMWLLRGSPRNLFRVDRIDRNARSGETWASRDGLGRWSGGSCFVDILSQAGNHSFGFVFVFFWFLKRLALAFDGLVRWGLLEVFRCR